MRYILKNFQYSIISRFVLNTVTGCVVLAVAAAGHVALAEQQKGAAIEAPQEPDGYRMSAYRGAVPKTLKGGTVVSDKEAAALWQAKETVFIDVLPRIARPKQLPEGMVWKPKLRENIPGSVWLPNVGFGDLNERLDTYFRSNLAALTKGDKAKPIVIYCLANCWMSWNAAKRAISYGYVSVHWYPDGTNGWIASGGKVEPCDPVPIDGNEPRS